MAKYNDAKREGNKRWDAANLDRISIAIPRGEREVIKAHAAAHNESLNRFIKRAIKETMQRDNEQPGE